MELHLLIYMKVIQSTGNCFYCRGIIENYDIKVDNSLKPLFDLVWNAGGCRGSLNFDEKGNWITR